MDVRYLLLLFLLVSCLPASVNKGNLSSSGTANNQTPTTSTIPESATKWNYLGSLSPLITINASNLNSAYIVGKGIEDYLATDSAVTLQSTYCLISRYVVSGKTFELRSRVVPISYYDFTAKRTIRTLRVDFNDVTNSTNSCATNLLLKVLDANGVLQSDVATMDGKTVNPAQVCPSCSSTLSSSKLLFFQNKGTTLEELTNAQIDLRTLSLSIDPNSTVATNTGTCTKSDCAARGFDCCLDNQCIKDGSVKPIALTSNYLNQYQSAEQERLSNPLAYLNYPQLYYICGSSVPTTSDGSTPTGTYEQGLTQLKKDYFCLEHIKKYKTAPTFHQDLITGISFPDKAGVPDLLGQPSTLYPTDIECRDASAPLETMNYLKVAERLYKNCGCAKTTLADMVAYCPAYDYTVNYMENGLPNRIDCFTPNSTPSQAPLQQTVSVNSRSAPHRYFRTCGQEFGNSSTCPSGDNQEGDFFEYLDTGNIMPSQQAFGMNSILGQMKVTLDKALPAKSVNVELDQVYQISTTSGFYSPCPTCAKDSWFTSFSAYPTTAYGTGLQAVGHSTTRDLFGNNSTGGNYEDTIFGRACWLPPTMLPFSHSSVATTTAQEQRLARLKTQSALYANGYQRDWYGFNKGALIGSFDGVTWFAVGKGRIVRSTSKKLYLAINAPFADLASPTLHVVNVQAYDGITQAAQVDYDPSLHLSHPYQNEAGNCQANHLCSTDTDCVTRLGWEYMCADVQNVSTQWPQFDVNANEIPNSAAVLTLDKILQQKKFPSASTKRCVYRGAGSVCTPSPLVISDLNKRKTLTCAPNFYCANINAGAVFNSKVSRYAANLEDIPVTRNHYFGKDANVLGRPLSYVASSLTTGLPSDVKLNLSQNMSVYEPLATNATGICLPGKALPELANQTTLYSPYEQHKNADGSGRTDFISQIGSCNSGLFTDYRYTSCPVMNVDGNYDFLSTTYSLSTYAKRARGQNSCGLDTLLVGTNLTSSADTLLASSPFRAIESKPLNLQTVTAPSFARDACLRRAGSVCHTDLDCGPNKLHAEQAENFSMAYFGNEAEKKYYSEYLVCGQADAKPSPLDVEANKAYLMNKNRCCREVGSDLSTYTSFTPQKLLPDQSTNLNTTTTDDSYQALTYGLNMSAPGLTPNSKYRYSRLATVENLGLTVDRPILSAFQDRNPAPPVGATTTLLAVQGANVTTPYQWKTLSETNSETCCGGGWIRKFSDGTNDWSRRDRVYMDVKNFACINSKSVMLTHPADVKLQYGTPTVAGDVDAQNLANQDIGDYCKDAVGTKGACVLYTISDSPVETPPTNNPVITTTTALEDQFKTFGILFPTYRDFYFHPRSADSDKDVTIDYTKTGGRRNITVKIPSFITRTSFDNPEFAAAPNTSPGIVRVFDLTDETKEYACEKEPTMPAFPLPTTDDTTGTYCNSTFPGTACCYEYDRTTRVLRVMIDKGNPLADNIGPTAPATIKKVGVKIYGASPAGSSGLITRTRPGSSLYYLKRLGKFELTGIPQITYEPLTCNDNSDRLVPGLFKMLGVTDMRKSHFINDNFSFLNSYTDPETNATVTDRYTNRYGLDHEPVFSENDFKCCVPLGKTTQDKTKCCSGHGTGPDGATTFTCSLPDGADLMVYFNSFVSNEGRGTDQPGGGLVEADFHSRTGEPKFMGTVTSKIQSLGQAYCDSKKVRLGGAFGAFKLEPEGNDTNQNETIYGIVDSSKDEGKVTTTGGDIPVGYSSFMDGFRWNHHLYCTDQ